MSAAPWEHKIRVHAALVKFCVATDNHGPLDAAMAVNPSFFSAGPLDDTTKKMITDHAVDLTNQGKAEYDQKSQEWEKIKDEQNPDKPAWETKIRAGGEELKKRLDKMVDDGTESMVQKVAKLPEDTRDAAADGWNATLDVVVKFFQQIWTGIQKLWDTIVNFFEQLWEQLKKVGQAIADGWNKAVSWIKGIFGFYYEADTGAEAGQTVQIPHDLLHPEIQTLLGSVGQKTAGNDNSIATNANPAPATAFGRAATRLSIKKGPDGWVIDPSF